MSIFEMRQKSLVRVSSTTFEAERLGERRDIQRLLNDSIDCLEDGLMVLAEEFSDWQDSSRRIDLLCLDSNANLVVVELKRSSDGGHMELQAIRYAAMVSAMTFEQAVDAHTRHRAKIGKSADREDAKVEILSFLGWSEPDEEAFARDTRVILAAADFGKELTTSVMWLRDRQIDIRCVRLKPYRTDDSRVLVDIEQIIPLPEASDFQTKIGAKKTAERKEQVERYDLRFSFWKELLTRARERTDLHVNHSPGNDTWISGSIGRAGFAIVYGLRQTDNDVRLEIAKDKQAFDALFVHKDEIEAAFGSALVWREKPTRYGSAIEYVQDGGYRSASREWPAIQDRMIDAMILLDRVFRSRIQALPR